MDVAGAYLATRSYRAAAAICGTTHKTVRRVLERRACQQPRRPVRPGFRAHRAVHGSTSPLAQIAPLGVRATGFGKSSCVPIS
jgi:hypothetical protein